MEENVSESRPTSGRSGETLIRVAVCAASGLLVSLGWILVGTDEMYLKTFSLVTVLTALAATSLVVGYTRAEAAKLRRELAQTEARLLAEIRTLRAPPAPPALSRNGKRSQPVRRGLRRRPPTDPVISNDLRIFLQGRESAYEDDDGA